MKGKGKQQCIWTKEIFGVMERDTSGAASLLFVLCMYVCILWSGLIQGIQASILP